MRRKVSGADLFCCCFVSLFALVAVGWFVAAGYGIIYVHQCMDSRAALDDVQWQAASCTVESRGVGSASKWGVLGSRDGRSNGDIPIVDCPAEGRRLTGAQPEAVPRSLNGQPQYYYEDVYVPWLEVAVSGQSQTRCLYRWGTDGCFAIEEWKQAKDFYEDHPEGAAIQCFDDGQGGSLALHAEGAPSSYTTGSIVGLAFFFFVPCLCIVPGICWVIPPAFSARLVSRAGCAPSDDSSESEGSGGGHDDDEPRSTGILTQYYRDNPNWMEDTSLAMQKQRERARGGP